MERHAFAMKIKEGRMNTYRKKLGEIWKETESEISASGMQRS